MKIIEDVRKYAAEQAISEEEALKKGMEEPSAANRSGAEIAEGNGRSGGLPARAKRSGVKSRKSSWKRARRFTRRRKKFPFLPPLNQIQVTQCI